MFEVIKQKIFSFEKVIICLNDWMKSLVYKLFKINKTLGIKEYLVIEYF